MACLPTNSYELKKNLTLKYWYFHLFLFRTLPLKEIIKYVSEHRAFLKIDVFNKCLTCK